MRFKFRLVLADRRYGESGEFIEALNQHQLQFVVEDEVTTESGCLKDGGGSCTRWKKFERIFSNGDTQVRYIREIVFGKRRHLRYWQITTDPVELPENCTWFIMTNASG